MPTPKNSGPLNTWQRLVRMDPRYFQSAVLGALLLYGLTFLDFDISSTNVILTLTAALFAQWAATKLWKLPQFDPKSAFISGLSLCLLFRTNDPALFVLAAGLAIFSKFVIRWRGKHIFNPTNFALVVSWFVFGRDAWISPGQWGYGAILGFLTACLGSFVVNRAARSDVTWAFLGSYSVLLFGRALWLGDPWAIPVHMLSNGGLILFAFYMISDPKTTPSSRAGRIIFAFLVAAMALSFQFGLYRPRGLYFALVIISMLTPVFDKLLPKRGSQGSAAEEGIAAVPLSQPLPQLALSAGPEQSSAQ